MTQPAAGDSRLTIYLSPEQKQFEAERTSRTLVRSSARIRAALAEYYQRRGIANPYPPPADANGDEAA